jgi:hypothetical protein
MAGLRDRPLLLPLGHYLGVSPTGGRHRHTVMRGGDPLWLADAELAVWLASRGVWPGGRDAGQDRAAVLAQARRLGVPDGRGTVDRLIRRGLLVELAPSTSRAVDFGRSHRVVPLMLGLGNRPDEPLGYRIGFFAEPTVRVAGSTYRVWQLSRPEVSLWASCRAHASRADRAGLAGTEEWEPISVLNRFLAVLPELLAFGAAYLDRVGRP